MAINDKTYRYTRATFGDMRSNSTIGKRNIMSTSFAYTHVKKKPATASTTAIFPATAVATAGQTFTSGFTNPDVPRAITVTVGASVAADIAAGTIVVTGVNIAGKTFTENFAVTADTAATINGTKAFKRITSVAVPAQDGNSVTVAVGTRGILGLNHFLPSGATVKTLMNNNGTVTLADPTASTTSTTALESNTVTPATAPNSTRAYTFYYTFNNWHLDPTNGTPDYGAGGN